MHMIAAGGVVAGFLGRGGCGLCIWPINSNKLAKVETISKVFAHGLHLSKSF